jgi:hypothetical protein
MKRIVFLAMVITIVGCSGHGQRALWVIVEDWVAP